MIHIDAQTELLWWITRSIDDSIVLYGLLEIGQVLDSGQEVLETFLTEEDWIVRLAELGIIIT
jgi:hypothetical protein